MLAALGAGLVLTAVGAGALTDAGGAVDGAGGTRVGGAVTGAVLAGCGLAALGWAAFALRAGRVPASRATLAASLAVLAVSGALLATGWASSFRVAVLPLLAADVLVVVVALGSASELRRGRGRRRSPGAAADRTPLVGLAVGATLVAALASPALAGTAAGDLAVPHGELHGTGHQHP